MVFLAAGDTEGAEEAGKVINPIIPDPSEMFWGALTFALLYLLVKFVLLPPVKRVMNDREATITADRDAAERARQQASSVNEETQDELADVRAEAAAILEEAREEAESERRRLVGRAEREVKAMRELAETEVSEARANAMESMQPQVSELAVGAASRVLSRQVRLQDAQPVIDRHLSNPN